MARLLVSCPEPIFFMLYFRKMEILKINHQKLEKGKIKNTIDLLKRGKVVICPTDTVYGLICDANNKKAVARLFKIKKRPKNKPILVFVKDIKMAKELAYISKNQGKFLKKVWPGKVTVVLKRKVQSAKLKIYGVNKKTVALRIPNHKVISYLLSVIGLPLTGTSANISGKPASTKIKEVLKQFPFRHGSGQGEYQPDLVIDAGNLPRSKPSKVIDLTVFPYKTLRP